MSTPNPATRAQHAAANPRGSVWLSANAGSGKTKVLTDRVARHLLGGVSPERILCLTYTKAAASEMQNRLFKRLGGWAMLPEEELRKALAGLGVETGALTPDLVGKARTLFARAIETPGGLKIQTIHSFCSGLLRRFPMEAGLPPQFTELDEPATRALRKSVLSDLAKGSECEKLDAMAAIVAEANFDSFLAEVSEHSEALLHPEAEDSLRAGFGLSKSDSVDALLSEVFQPGDEALLLRVVEALAMGSPTDVKHGFSLRSALQTPRGSAFLGKLEAVFLTGEKAKQGPYTAKIPGFPTKKTRENLGSLKAPLDALMTRVEAGRSRRLALELMAKNRILLDFAKAYVTRLKAAKDAQGVLDFDDLILNTRALLTNPSVAQWVLFRLDGGIDHILVDEAQDTSPAQWDVIRLLAQEFTSGQGSASDRARTIFVVGDPKQSIYSFQGADPGGFDRMRGFFGRALAQIDAPFSEYALEYSFRSSPGILSFVDKCFETAGHTGLGHLSNHLAFHENLPGRVDLWPALPKPEIPEKPPWYDPVDIQDVNDPKLELARHVAGTVDELLRSGEQIQSSDGRVRPVEARDVLILVQRRSTMFHEIIRSCKALGIPIAGADRLQVGAELAVKDLIALLSFLTTPEDDLSLACVLKSPLFNWSEKELYSLAQPRGGRFLWAALREAEADHPETTKVLRDLRDAADFMRPYELLERILIRHGGRAKLVARLGHEAEDGIDALLAQAITYEYTNVPSLTGFVSWFLSDDLTIKRQMDNQRNEVRVMTVHGAKGLEAPIVILPDCAKSIDRSHQDRLLALEDKQTSLRPSRNDAPLACRDAAAQERQAAADERMRLLYVAMTRAESWLIIAAAGDTGQGLDSWHAIASDTMNALGLETQPLNSPTGEGVRLPFGSWPSATDQTMDTEKQHTRPLVLSPLPTPATRPEPVSPSELSGEKALPGVSADQDRDAAMERGTRLHLLLEHLPKHPRSEWLEHAKLLLGEDAKEQDIDALVSEAISVLTAPQLEPFFAPDALAEVDVTAFLSQLGRAMIGTIDRLVVTETTVSAIDFKSNKAVPESAEQTPLGILRQMGAYLVALEAIYPEHKVGVSVVWTHNSHLMELPTDLVRSALDSESAVSAGP